MGFFDRFAKKNTPATNGSANSLPSPVPAPGSVQARLLEARAKLDAKDLPAALAIYEALLASAGDRADVLVTLSGDLGVTGNVDSIIELIAPRYDAERHGPATGLNLLQAYLAVRNPTAAQHLLDILFALNQPELEQRLHGFSNAIAELIASDHIGETATQGGAPRASAEVLTINLASISKPIWAYGVENLPGLLPPKTGKPRRIAFAQLALPGLANAHEQAKKPENALSRLSRGIPLWLAETFAFCPHYASIGVIGLVGKEHYAIFGTEWSPNNIRQLVSTAGEGLDYVFIGALREKDGDCELILRLWEVKKFRERKTFTFRWSPANADAELLKLNEHLRLFMEWSACPAGAGLAYTPPDKPLEWADTLGTSLSYFLTEKGVLPPAQLADPAEALARVASRAGHGESATVAWLTIKARAHKLGLADSMPTSEPTLVSTPLTKAAQDALA